MERSPWGSRGTAELRVEVEGACLAVAEELRIHGEPGGASGGAAHGDLLGEVVGDRAEDPGLDNTIHACPVWIAGGRLVEEDVLL